MRPRLKQLEQGGASSNQYLAWDQQNGIWAPRTNRFGENYSYAVSDGVSSTSGVSFVQKLSLSTGSIPAGYYLINWSFLWAHTGLGYGAVRVQLDNTTDLSVDTAVASGTSEWLPACGSCWQSLSAASHTIDIDYYNNTLILGTTWIYGARLAVWRES